MSLIISAATVRDIRISEQSSRDSDDTLYCSLIAKIAEYQALTSMDQWNVATMERGEFVYHAEARFGTLFHLQLLSIEREPGYYEFELRDMRSQLLIKLTSPAFVSYGRMPWQVEVTNEGKGSFLLRRATERWKTFFTTDRMAEIPPKELFDPESPFVRDFLLHVVSCLGIHRSRNLK